MTREDRRWLMLTLGLTALLASLAVWWLAADRRGFPLDIDEAGYMTIALADHAALAHGGLASYWHAVESQAPYAPLVPALTALVYVVRTSILASYTVQLAFMLLLAAASYGVARRLAGPRLAALAALLTVSAPGTIDFSREYLFALPSVALLSAGVYALLASDGLRERRWALAAGLALGLMLLARTMSIAILPAVVLAGAVRVVTLERGRAPAALNLLLAVGLCLGLAAIWYAPNLHPVFRYLTDYGYGARSGEYGSSQSVVSSGWWTRELQEVFSEDLYLPLGLAVLAGALVAAAGAAHRILRSPSRRSALLAAARGDALSVAIVFAGAYLALSSSRNRGAGFALMLVPSLVALAVLALRGAGRARGPVIAVLGVIAVLNVLVSTDLWHGLSTPRRADVPVLGSVPVLDGEGHALAALRRQLPGSPTQFGSAERAWPRAAERAAQLLLAFAHAHGRQPVVAFGMRNRVFNTNTVALAARLYYAVAIPMAQLDPKLAGDTEAAYASFLADPLHGQPNFLLTTSTAAGDFTPIVTQRLAVAAARRERFRPVSRLALPDGRIVTLWWLQRGPSYDPARG